MENDQIVIYQSPDGQTSVDVKIENETIWLTQEQMAKLFEKAKSTINEHIKNIYNEKELDIELTMNKFGNTEFAKKPVYYYNLDVIISVGYRVKSQRGTQFRIWANQTLKEYLVKGYAIDKKRFLQQSRKLEELKQAVKLLGNAMESKALNSEEATGLLRVITDYTYALDVLDKYDQHVLEIQQTSARGIFKITYAEAIKAIWGLKEKFGGSPLFGNEKDESFRSSLAAIYQTFDGQDVYLSVEEKAANLLYFIIKNHSFTDGNKRIAAFLFVWFLEKNAILYKVDGSRRLADNALVALTLMIAESSPDEKDSMVKVLVNLINANN